MKNTPIYVAAVLFMFVGAAIAGGYYDHHGGNIFSKNIEAMDADQDGTVTFEEFNASMIEQNEVVFNALDNNGDGRIDEAEWNEFLRVHGVAVQG